MCNSLFSRRFRGQLSIYCLAVCLTSVCQVCIPWLVGKTIDEIVSGNSLSFFFACLLILAIVYLLIEQLAILYVTKIAWQWKSDLRQRLLDAFCIKQPEEENEQNQQSEIGMKFMRDVPILGEALQRGIPQLLRTSIMFAFSLLIAFWQCWQIGLILSFSIPLLLLIHLSFRHRFIYLAHQTRLVQDNLCSRVFEFLNAYPELKALEAESPYRGHVSSNLEDISAIEYANATNHVAFQRCFAVLLFFCEYATLGIACLLASRGRLLVGQIVFFQIMIMRVLNGGVSVLQLLPHLVAVREARDSLKALLMNSTPATLPDSSTFPLSNGIETIALDNVSFAYPNSMRMILENYSLRISRGEVIALEGVNGVGKTTLWKILTGWLTPTRGSVIVNGYALPKHLQDYRRRIAFVTQKTLLFYGTLAENITLGESDIRKNDLQVALKLSGFCKVIERFPEGLDRHIESDAGLSGGECQRLALARALYRKPELLILDEVTNHMDVSGKETVKALMHTLRGKVTILVVSHEADIRELCDREVVLQ